MCVQPRTFVIASCSTAAADWSAILPHNYILCSTPTYDVFIAGAGSGRPPWCWHWQACDRGVLPSQADPGCCAALPSAHEPQPDNSDGDRPTHTLHAPEPRPPPHCAAAAANPAYLRTMVRRQARHAWQPGRAAGGPLLAGGPRVRQGAAPRHTPTCIHAMMCFTALVSRTA